MNCTYITVFQSRKNRKKLYQTPPSTHTDTHRLHTPCCTLLFSNFIIFASQGFLIRTASRIKNPWLAKMKLYESDETKYLDFRDINYHVKSHIILQSLGRNTCMAIRMKHYQCTWKFETKYTHFYEHCTTLAMFFILLF